MGASLSVGWTDLLFGPAGPSRAKTCLVIVETLQEFPVDVATIVADYFHEPFLGYLLTVPGGTHAISFADQHLYVLSKDQRSVLRVNTRKETFRRCFRTDFDIVVFAVSRGGLVYCGSGNRDIQVFSATTGELHNTVALAGPSDLKCVALSIDARSQLPRALVQLSTVGYERQFLSSDLGLISSVPVPLAVAQSLSGPVSKFSDRVFAQLAGSTPNATRGFAESQTGLFYDATPTDEFGELACLDRQRRTLWTCPMPFVTFVKEALDEAGKGKTDTTLAARPGPDIGESPYLLDVTIDHSTGDLYACGPSGHIFFLQ